MSHFPLSWVQSGLQQLWQQQLRRKLWTYSKYWYGKRFVFRIGMHYPCFLFSFSPPPPPPFMANDTVSGYALIIRKRLSVYSMLHLSTRQVPTFGPNICLGHGRQHLSPLPPLSQTEDGVLMASPIGSSSGPTQGRSAAGKMKEAAQRVVGLILYTTSTT